MNNCKMCKMFQAHRPSEDWGRLSPIDPNRGYPGPLADHPITGLGLYPDTMSLIARLNTFGYFFYTMTILSIFSNYKFSVYIHYP